jgi:mRNA interferase RelE/StbE
MMRPIEFKPRAFKDLEALPEAESRRVLAKVAKLQDDLAGDVKRLTNYSPEYRPRVGNYRVLSDLEGPLVVIYRMPHRKDAYK